MALVVVLLFCFGGCHEVVVHLHVCVHSHTAGSDPHTHRSRSATHDNGSQGHRAHGTKQIHSGAPKSTNLQTHMQPPIARPRPGACLGRPMALLEAELKDAFAQRPRGTRFGQQFSVTPQHSSSKVRRAPGAARPRSSGRFLRSSIPRRPPPVPTPPRAAHRRPRHTPMPSLSHCFGGPAHGMLSLQAGGTSSLPKFLEPTETSAPPPVPPCPRRRVQGHARPPVDSPASTIPTHSHSTGRCDPAQPNAATAVSRAPATPWPAFGRALQRKPAPWPTLSCVASGSCRGGRCSEAAPAHDGLGPQLPACAPCLRRFPLDPAGPPPSPAAHCDASADAPGGA